jgi:hypothetical protein
VRLVVFAAIGVTRFGFDDWLAIAALALVAVIVGCGWWLRGDEA